MRYCFQFSTKVFLDNEKCIANTCIFFFPVDKKLLTWSTVEHEHKRLGNILNDVR